MCFWYLPDAFVFPTQCADSFDRTSYLIFFMQVAHITTMARMKATQVAHTRPYMNWIGECWGTYLEHCR